MVAVGGDHMVVGAAQGDRADGDGFLTDVEMEEAAHFAAVVVFQRGLLEPADAHHRAEQADFFIGGQCSVHSGACEVKTGSCGGSRRHGKGGAGNTRHKALLASDIRSSFHTMCVDS